MTKFFRFVNSQIRPPDRHFCIRLWSALPAVCNCSFYGPPCLCEMFANSTRERSAPGSQMERRHPVRPRRTEFRRIHQQVYIYTYTMYHLYDKRILTWT